MRSRLQNEDDKLTKVMRMPRIVLFATGAKEWGSGVPARMSGTG